MLLLRYFRYYRSLGYDCWPALRASWRRCK